MVAAEKRILLIDDQPEIISMMKTNFAEHGWTIATAQNGKIGLSQVDEFQPNVIVSDIAMPVMTGIELLKELCLREIEIPVILLSGSLDAKNMKSAWQLSAFDFQDKPFDPLQLNHAAMAALSFGKEYVHLARKRFFVCPT